MNTLFYIDELYMIANKHLENDDNAEARKTLHKILLEDPTYGKAHNAMGWLLYVKLDEYAAAEIHYKAAIQFEPTLPYVYFNYVNFLIYQNRYREARKIAFTGLEVGGSSKSAFWAEIGRSFELEEQYREAMKAYYQALRKSTEKSEIERMRANIARARAKMGLSLKRWLLSF